ncbi:hypothetical protein [Mesorhizobium sp. SP-1A]|uniref:hypothetical protein n=1 Tax=Mesorhizobium sp. SP-1A TaxID=3077840 RepID=UPI0028F6E54B|nr:hypothetical protein [Mesorhizobium sp. SP-1A]
MSAALVRSARVARGAGGFSALLPAVAAFFLLAGQASAHDAKPTPAQPLGWHYPFSCCADYDCRAATKGEVLERPEGYVITDTGEVVPMTDKRIKDSPDGQYHWCAHKGGLDAGRTICLFVPPRSF